MGFGAAIKSVFSQYVGFSGRARRSEFWWWYLFVSLVNIVMSTMWSASLVSLSGAADIEALFAGMFNWAYFLWIIISLALFLPTLAVIWRRLHDTDRSGGFYFLVLIPLVGAIILLVFFIQEGTQGENRFGPDPKA